MKISETHKYTIDKNNKIISRVYAMVPQDKSEPVYMFRLWTRKSHRRKKFATKVLNQAIKEWKSRPIKLRACSGDEALTTEDLIKFYTSLGFVRRPKTNTIIRNRK